MRFLTAAAVVTTASAFLLPPTISNLETDIVHALPFDMEAAADGRTIEVACPGCPIDIVDITGQVNAVTSQMESALRLNFDINHGADGEADQLLLNGVQIYPVDELLLSQTTLTADQIVKTSDRSWNYVGSPNLGFGLDLHRVNSDFISVKVSIYEVGGKYINGMSTADLQILETPSRKLMIGDAQIKPAKPDSVGEKCTNIVCKWKAIVAAKLAELKASKLKGCGGRPKQFSGHGKHDGHSKHDHGRQGHGPRPHGNHRHRRHGGLARLIRGIVFHVLIPVFIGVVVGVTASFIGMIVGHLAIFLWRTVFRRGQQSGYQKVGQDEFKSFTEQESPPEYEDAPAYEDTAAEKQ